MRISSGTLVGTLDEKGLRLLLERMCTGLLWLGTQCNGRRLRTRYWTFMSHVTCHLADALLSRPHCCDRIVLTISLLLRSMITLLSQSQRLSYGTNIREISWYGLDPMKVATQLRNSAGVFRREEYVWLLLYFYDTPLGKKRSCRTGEIHRVYIYI